MSEASDLLARAQARAAAYQPKQIDYERARRNGRKLKAQLTRAERSKDPEKVVLACKAALDEWEAWGAWPDEWSRWQRALDDVLPWNQTVRLEDLQ